MVLSLQSPAPTLEKLMFALESDRVNYSQPRILFEPCGHRINVSSTDPRLEIAKVNRGYQGYPHLKTEACPKCQSLALLGEEFIDSAKLTQMLEDNGFSSIEDLKALIGRKVEVTWKEIFARYSRRITAPGKSAKIDVGIIATFYVFPKEDENSPQELGVILTDGGYCAWRNMNLLPEDEGA